MVDTEPVPDADIELVARVASGDKQAFETLFTDYGERVFRYAHRLIHDVPKAEEVTNDVMIEVWKNAAKFEARSKVSTWILGITRHLALNAVRGKKLDTVDVDLAPEIVDPSASAERGAVADERADLQQKLRAALAELSADHRDVIELTFFHGCSYQEIAAIVDCPENTVKTRMYHARKQLQGILPGLGLDAGAYGAEGVAT
ncbi:MAG: sigma-70 family RNA polymerase sigma factor [Gammaproteobacteria bacterium]|nr:MAG: sigma-70 family RNA polymerase sigma factor [Gammaproteobacteria bacterium]